MKSYSVFIGYDYMEEGGWKDFAYSFDTREEAIKYLQTNGVMYDWYHIVLNSKIIMEGTRKEMRKQRGH